MSTLSKEAFKKLANDIMFDLDDNEVIELEEEFEDLMKQMELLNKINTDDIREMVYPFEAATTYMREDEVDNVLVQEDVLVNAAKVSEGYVKVPKVVK